MWTWEQCKLEQLTILNKHPLNIKFSPFISCGQSAVASGVWNNNTKHEAGETAKRRQMVTRTRTIFMGENKRFFVGSGGCVFLSRKKICVEVGSNCCQIVGRHDRHADMGRYLIWLCFPWTFQNGVWKLAHVISCFLFINKKPPAERYIIYII